MRSANAYSRHEFVRFLHEFIRVHHSFTRLTNGNGQNTRGEREREEKKQNGDTTETRIFFAKKHTHADHIDVPADVRQALRMRLALVLTVHSSSIRRFADALHGSERTIHY